MIRHGEIELFDFTLERRITENLEVHTKAATVLLLFEWISRSHGSAFRLLSRFQNGGVRKEIISTREGNFSKWKVSLMDLKCYSVYILYAILNGGNKFKWFLPGAYFSS